MHIIKRYMQQKFRELKYLRQCFISLHMFQEGSPSPLLIFKRFANTKSTKFSKLKCCKSAERVKLLHSIRQAVNDWKLMVNLWNCDLRDLRLLHRRKIWTKHDII